MTKADIIASIVAKTGIEQETVSVCVEGFMHTVKNSLSKGENVYLRGFGTFEIITRKQKTARNITAGTTLIVPEHNIPHFKPGKDFDVKQPEKK